MRFDTEQDCKFICQGELSSKNLNCCSEEAWWLRDGDLGFHSVLLQTDYGRLGKELGFSEPLSLTS